MKALRRNCRTWAQHRPSDGSARSKPIRVVLDMCRTINTMLECWQILGLPQARDEPLPFCGEHWLFLEPFPRSLLRIPVEESDSTRSSPTCLSMVLRERSIQYQKDFLRHRLSYGSRREGCSFRSRGVRRRTSDSVFQTAWL